MQQNRARVYGIYHLMHYSTPATPWAGRELYIIDMVIMAAWGLRHENSHTNLKVESNNCRKI